MATRRVKLGSNITDVAARIQSQLLNFSPCVSFPPYFVARYVPRNGIWESIIEVFSSCETAISVVNSFSKFLRDSDVREMRGLSHLRALYTPFPRRNKSPKKRI